MKMFYLVGKTFSVNYRYFDQRVAKGACFFILYVTLEKFERQILSFYMFLLQQIVESVPYDKLTSTSGVTSLQFLSTPTIRMITDGDQQPMALVQHNGGEFE